MASVSKLFPRQTDRMGMNFFSLFFGNQGSDEEKVRQKITMMARGSKDSEKPKNRIGKKIARENFGLKTARGSPDSIFFRDLRRQGNTNRNLD